MPLTWTLVKPYEDIFYHKADGIAKITINRPHKRNAFRPQTITELYDAFSNAREDTRIGVVLLTGAGPHTDGKYAFCSGGDQSVRGQAGYILAGLEPAIWLALWGKKKPVKFGIFAVSTVPSRLKPWV